MNSMSEGAQRANEESDRRAAIVKQSDQLAVLLRIEQLLIQIAEQTKPSPWV